MIKLTQSRVVFTDNPHSYHLGDKELKGVTSILSKHIFTEKYFGVSEEVLNAAAERGSRIHENCRAYDVVGFVACDEVQAYADIKRSMGLVTIANEYTVSDEENVASKIDCVMAYEGEDEVILVDYKTTSHFDIEYLSWQLSIYKYLFELQNPGVKVKGLMGIWLPLSKYGKPKAEFIAEKPQSEIKKLLKADAEGSLYAPPPSNIPPEVIMLQERCLDTLVRLKEVEEESKKLHETLLAAMEMYDVKKWETDKFSCTRTLPTEQERFDSKKFKEEHPDMAEKYTKKVKVKGSVRITIKK
ncbi:MAG: PD-(D/E)XK nuclease family protein [Prevotella sp.]|nr:PD-(D/E)XK nuclease family protein [Candidatus Prevotella equi]